MSLWSFLVGVGIQLILALNVTIRWALLLRSYGASDPPGFVSLLRFHLAGLFFNLLPGNVGGDVVRSALTRNSFGEQNMTASLAIVVADRAMGLAGLLLLVAIGLAVRPLLAVNWPVVVTGLVAVVTTVFGIAAGRDLAAAIPNLVPKFARKQLERLPRVESWQPLVPALAISVLSHMLLGMMGYLFISLAEPGVRVADSLILAPVAFAAAYIPITVAGAGTRDAAMVALFGLVGVSEAAALVASLQVLATYLVVAGLGGIVTLLRPPF